eukprot:TRINITY_DN9159_c0_g1_i1.p2 TRINITY_DN9159_c0_g1~~TRINITY_DN9159_c0_g1_i1.p2  ORF type:complete len:136 (-),score=23.45 TRINITY_DN9159_c0_g1_i1:939-1346(-)
MAVSEILVASSVLSFVFAAFHATFPFLFSWPQTLSSLNQVNGAIFLTYHYLIILMLVICGVMCIMLAFQKTPFTRVEKAFLISWSLFFLGRIACAPLFGLTMIQLYVCALCLGTVACFSLPLFVTDDRAKNTKSS